MHCLLHCLLFNRTAHIGTAHTDADLATFRKYGVTKGLLGACIYEALNLSRRALAPTVATT